MRSIQARHLITGLLATLATAALPANPVLAQTGGGANNLVQVVTTAEGSFQHRAQVQAASYAGESVQSTNLARAAANNCVGCRSQAAALQAVFVTGDPEVVQPANAAVATTSNCQHCVSYAFAYQYVFSAPRQFVLSPQGHVRLTEINQRADAVIAQALPQADLDIALRALADELKSVVDNELRAAGLPVTGREFATSREAAA